MLSTFLFWICVKKINKKKKRLNIYLTMTFSISYFILFYIVQTSSPIEIKNWHIIDSIMNGIAGIGFLVVLYTTYNNLKHFLKKVKR